MWRDFRYWHARYPLAVDYYDARMRGRPVRDTVTAVRILSTLHAEGRGLDLSLPRVMEAVWRDMVEDKLFYDLLCRQEFAGRDVRPEDVKRPEVERLARVKRFEKVFGLDNAIDPSVWIELKDPELRYPGGSMRVPRAVLLVMSPKQLAAVTGITSPYIEVQGHIIYVDADAPEGLLGAVGDVVVVVPVEDAVPVTVKLLNGTSVHVLARTDLSDAADVFLRRVSLRTGVPKRQIRLVFRGSRCFKLGDEIRPLSYFMPDGPRAAIVWSVLILRSGGH